MAAIAGQPAPKPSQVKEPVPTKNTASAVDSFFADYDAPAPVDMVEEPMPEETPMEAPGIGSQALDAAGRVLDSAGGLVRTGIAATGTAPAPIPGETEMEYQERLQANPSIVTPEDVRQTLRGEGPDTAEYLRRLGVPEGGSLGSGKFKVTARGAAGLVGDIATDPLTSVVKLVKGVPFLKKLLEAPGKATEALGEAVYKSAVAGVDSKLAKKGLKSGIGDALISQGAPVGTSAKLAEKVNDASSVMRKIRQGLYDRVSAKGVTIDPGFPLKRTEAVLKRMYKDRGLAPAAEELRDLMTRYKTGGPVSIEDMSMWKTNLYDSLPDSAFGAHGKLKGHSKQFKAALAADFRDAIVGAGNAAEKGLGNAIDKVNEKWGLLLDASDPMTKEALNPSSRLGQMIDGAILATGGLKAAAVKKGFDVALSPLAKTTVGRALMEAGKTDLVNRLSRQTIAGVSRPSPLPPEEEIPQE